MAGLARLAPPPRSPGGLAPRRAAGRSLARPSLRPRLWPRQFLLAARYQPGGRRHRAGHPVAGMVGVGLLPLPRALALRADPDRPAAQARRRHLPRRAIRLDGIGVAARQRRACLQLAAPLADPGRAGRLPRPGGLGGWPGARLPDAARAIVPGGGRLGDARDAWPRRPRLRRHAAAARPDVPAQPPGGGAQPSRSRPAGQRSPEGQVGAPLPHGEPARLPRAERGGRPRGRKAHRLAGDRLSREHPLRPPRRAGAAAHGPGSRRADPHRLPGPGAGAGRWLHLPQRGILAHSERRSGRHLQQGATPALRRVHPHG